MADFDAIEEMTGEQGIWPGSLTFTLTKMSVKRIWFWGSPLGDRQGGFTLTDIQTLPQIVLGTTRVDISADAPGRLTRTLPLADPVYPWAFANALSNLKGIGIPITQAAPAITANGVLTYPGFGLYGNYSFEVDSTNRPYPILSDVEIPALEISWTDSSGGGQASLYYPEWRRFTSVSFKPLDNWISQQNLSAYFETSDNTEPGSATQPATFVGQARMPLPDSLITMRWEEVPLRYLYSNNSMLQKMKGFVNQFAWSGPLEMAQIAGQVGSFPAGSLLFLGADVVETYSPVVPMTWVGAGLEYGKLCDLDLKFLYTSRVTQKAPANVGNWIKAGWNALPYFNKRLFYSAYNQDRAGTKYPMFYSAPFELLFTDPDSAIAFTGAL